MNTHHQNDNVAHYTNPAVFKYTSDVLTHSLLHTSKQIVVICIGTDRSTGDSLGPQTGTYLAKLRPKHLIVLGTLHEPIHALNLEKAIIQINSLYENPFIIAVDAALGKTTSIGNITCVTGPVKPGAAFNKNLPEIGDISLTGIVNSCSLLDYSALQCTRLSLVYDMAKTLSSILYQVDLRLSVHSNKLNKNAQTS